VLSKHADRFRRNHYLDPLDPGAVDSSRAWWMPRTAWPAGMCFKDGETERVLDRDPLPLPVTAGMFSSTAALCEESRFAELEVDGVSAG
jgi:hypothetical protein